MFWSADDFVKCNRPWGKFRRLVGKIDILGSDGAKLAFIGLFREKCDGNLSISVHDYRNNYMVTKLGLYWVKSKNDKQSALDEIYLKLMEV